MHTRGKKIRQTLALILSVIICIVATGCGDTAAQATSKDDSLETVLALKRLTVGFDAAYPPMTFRDENGEITGFDIDMAKEVCKRMGVDMILKPIAWDEKEKELASGEIDCIWSGMSVTPDRAAIMELSEPYVRNELIFVVYGDSEVRVPADLEGKTIGVQAGSSTLDAIRESKIGKNAKIVVYDSIMHLLEKLRYGQLDAILIDSIVAYYNIFTKAERYYVLPDSLVEEECSIGFRKGDYALRDKVQELISEMKTDGTLGRISEKWFGSDITIVK